jgi:uncharacterized protein
MLINDRIYGRIKIESPVLIELIKSKPMQRLKGICQFGIPDKYYFKTNFYRFEHCVGVMVLLKKLGATEEEQIAGLLHDVSHTAFSHLYDWVIGDGKTEDHQDLIHEKYISSSEIPSILKKYGYNPKRITNYHHFGLLERTVPELCADRIDYALREFPKSIIKKCFLGLTVINNKIIFNNESSAYLFSKNYLQKQTKHWAGFEASARYRIFANILRKALTLGEIKEADFWKTDDYIIRKIEKSKDVEIKTILKILTQKSLKSLPKSNTKIYKKFRYVDPVFINKNKLIKLSKTNAKFRNLLKKARLQNKQGEYLPQI